MVYIIIGILILGADAITKYLAVDILAKVDTISIINNVFHLTYVENRGIAFGMFSGGRIVFVMVTFLILILLIYMLKRTESSARTIWLKCGTTLVISGAIGNLIDRIFRGYVVDFLDFRVINFPVFNVADIAVCVGAVMLMIHYLKSEQR